MNVNFSLWAVRNPAVILFAILVSLAGREQLVVQSRTHLSGVDPGTGSVLWSQEVPAFRGMNILTPLVHGDSVFTSAYGSRGFLYQVRPAEPSAELVGSEAAGPLHLVEWIPVTPELRDGGQTTSTFEAEYLCVPP